MPIDVVVVDDNEADARLIQRRLRASPKYEFTVRHFLDPAPVWEVFRGRPPDCLLLDYHLAGSTGLDFLARMREANLDVPVIAVTGEGNEDIATEALKLGAGDYLPKARITTESLTRAILNVIEKTDLQRRLHKQQTELQNFVSVVAHDLQQPLAAVRGCIEVVRDFYGNCLDERGRDMLETAVRTNQRMATMVDALLSHSRFGQVSRQLDPVDLDVVLDGVRKNLAQALEDSGGTLHVGRLPAVVGDDMALTRLFQNLVANALKFRGDHAPIVEVTGREADNQAEIVVRDNGIGIDPDRRDEIFLPFRRLHKDRYPGSGVGLATCARIVELHQGEIRVESEVGKGSRFIITLQRPLESAEAGRRGRGRTILVVDDDIAILRLLRSLLEREGFQVETAASVAEARAIQVGNRVDLLVTDLILPGESGFDMIRAIRELNRDLPIIGFSGGGVAQSEISPLLERAHELGADRVLGKPFDRGQLLGAIGDLLSGGSAGEAPEPSPEPVGAGS
ncbi:MAG: response regulator [Acidobacteria bacterium]|nr:response regulator [Acidobacteriota bacterium]